MPRVLMFEPDKRVRAAVERAVRAKRLPVVLTSACSLEEAMGCLRERPDALLIGISFPCRDGLTLLRAARNKGVYGAAIVFTATHDFDTENDILDLGAVPMTKPESGELFAWLVGGARSQERVRRIFGWLATPRADRISEGVTLAKGNMRGYLKGHELEVFRVGHIRCCGSTHALAEYFGLARLVEGNRTRADLRPEHLGCSLASNDYR